MAENYEWSMSDDRLEAIVDAAFIRVTGKSYRPEKKKPTASDPSTNGNQLGKEWHDFEKLFGDDA